MKLEDMRQDIKILRDLNECRLKEIEALNTEVAVLYAQVRKLSDRMADRDGY